MEAERSFYAQKAKCEYLKNGDRCTRFFHDLAKRNSKRNSIMSLCLDNGEFTSCLPQVEEEFVGFYTRLLGTSVTCEALDRDILNSGPVLSVDQRQLLAADVTSDEVCDALFSIGNDKAPGPDGFNAYFFKKSWKGRNFH